MKSAHHSFLEPKDSSFYCHARLRKVANPHSSEAKPSKCLILYQSNDESIIEIVRQIFF